ncbi:histidine--tRNA ligase [candidate division WOR-3 bacterium]|nr:histidine--tRNA ligase [candidate division WOR-3 bacterium]
MKIEPKLLKGMRDFLPEDMRKREYVIRGIKNIFVKYGFEPLETPAIEYWDVLSGKDRYGEEETLIYKFKDRGKRDVGLRFDFTVPLARVIAMYPEITMPFKRYQIQPVWRGDKPQHGRFREFYQCDIDIVGTHSMFADAEILAITCEIFSALGFKEFKIKINNRKILKAICECAGVSQVQEFTVYRAMDKFERIGIEGIAEELRSNKISNTAIKKILNILQTSKSILDLEKVLPQKEGLQELKSLFGYLETFNIRKECFSFDPWLARGLDYYTGPIFEVIVEKPKIGSLAGGGRFDKLIGMFSGREIPAVGIAIGLERIIAVMDELSMLSEIEPQVKILVTQFDEESSPYSISIANELRNLGLSTEIYPDFVKLSKQFKYASRRKIQWVIVAGPDEIKAKTVNIKNMTTGDQKSIKRDKLSLWAKKKGKIQNSTQIYTDSKDRHRFE